MTVFEKLVKECEKHINHIVTYKVSVNGKPKHGKILRITVDESIKAIWFWIETDKLPDKISHTQIDYCDCMDKEAG